MADAAQDPSPRWWAPVDAPPCAAPGRAVRLDEVARPRVRALAAILAEAPSPAPEPAPAPHVDATRDPRPDGADPGGLAAARATAVRVVGAVAETASGRRPAHHLATIVDDATRDALVPPLRALAGPSARAGPVRVAAVSASAVEVSATLHGATRSRALAARLERDPAGATWRVHLLVLV